MKVGSSSTGRTAGFDPANEGSIPSSRTLINCSLPSPCRLCGGPTWLQDDEGSLHPCCELSRRSGATVDVDGLLVCPSCKASEKLNREQRRRHG